MPNYAPFNLSLSLLGGFYIPKLKCICFKYLLPDFLKLIKSFLREAFNQRESFNLVKITSADDSLKIFNFMSEFNDLKPALHGLSLEDSGSKVM